MLITLGVHVENLLIEGTITGIVHAQHHGDHRWLVGEDVAFQPVVNGASAATGDPVATPARMNERDIQCGKPRDNVGFDECGIKPLVCDTVSIKDDPVSFFDCKGPLGLETAANAKNSAGAIKARPASLFDLSWPVRSTLRLFFATPSRHSANEDNSATNHSLPLIVRKDPRLTGRSPRVVGRC